MLYQKLTLHVPDDYHETLISELMEMDFDGFEQLEDVLIAYIPQPRFHDVYREQIEQMVQLFPAITSYEITEVAEENWNAVWEQTVQPQVIGSFLVKPTWSDREPDPEEILIQIDPKMSFGTGYHATTRLVLEELLKVDIRNRKVLDAGTGTGILAIACAKLGASDVTGFDIDPWCEQNALENVAVNGVEDRVKILLGGVETVSPDEEYDLLIANINRNVILALMDEFVCRVREGGTLIFTGILKSDRDIVAERARVSGLTPVSESTKEEWQLLQFQH